MEAEIANRKSRATDRVLELSLISKEVLERLIKANLLIIDRSQVDLFLKAIVANNFLVQTN